MPYIDIRIHVKAEEENYGDEKWVHYGVSGISQIGTDLPEGATDSLAESLAQSDFGSIDFSQGVISVIDGGEITFK